MPFIHAARSKRSDKDEDRDAPFQVLADGTQDLAALVGVFATDSVERYAIDYNKGYLSASSATLSLLGLLGYVRALIKLGLGPEKCNNAGFDTRSLRPLFGVPDCDRLPSEVVHDVHYVERLDCKDHVRWKLAGTQKHTVDTMPVLDKAVPYHRSDGNALTTCSVALTLRSQKSRRSAYYRIPMLFTGFIGATCFVIAFLRDGFAHQPWTMFYATFGLSFSLVISAMTWAWVYARQQLPAGCGDWILNSADKTASYKASHSKQDHFAFIGSRYSYVTFDLKLVRGRVRLLIRTMSMICALSAIVGYVCQYVEVRRTTPPQAAKWLAFQGFLAILRLAVWILNPSFDDFKMDRLECSGVSDDLHFSEAQMVMLWYTHIHPTKDRPAAGQLPAGLPVDQMDEKAPLDYEQYRRRNLRPIHWYEWIVPDELRVPAWVLTGLDKSRKDVNAVFQLAGRLHDTKKKASLQEDVETFTQAEFYWDMPGWLFMLWLDAHTNQKILANPSDARSYGCRVIRDKEGQQGQYHFLPFWRHGGITSADLTPIQIFGNPEEEARFFTAFDDSEADPDAADRARQQELFFGWDGCPALAAHFTSLDGSNMDHAGKVSQGIIDETKAMWKDLNGFLERKGK
ncbi:MAG: hypothetical protein Q9174_001866 [Haloplaca sp. 1 TL-2023]